MTKYYIKSYKKLEQSFLSRINSIDHTYGNTHEPYEITLDFIYFFGLLRGEKTIKVSLPGGFNHTKELKTGREWIN